MQRITKPLIQRTISSFFVNPIKIISSKYTSLVDIDRHEKSEALKDVFECISWVEEVHEIAEALKHRFDDAKYLLRSREYFEHLTYEFDYARSKLPANNETILSLEPKMSRLEARVKEIENDYRKIYIGECVLGFVLRINKERANIRWFHDITTLQYTTIRGCFQDYYSSWISSSYKYLMYRIGDDEMQLLRWMEVQIQLMKDDLPKLYAFERFMQIPWFQKDATKILETAATSLSYDKQQEKNKEKENDMDNIDDIILDTIIKIAKARYMFCSVFAGGSTHFAHRFSRDGHIRFALREIERSSRSYDYLMMKIPKDYNMTLRRWVVINIKPELEKLLAVELN